MGTLQQAELFDNGDDNVLRAKLVKAYAKVNGGWSFKIDLFLPTIYFDFQSFLYWAPRVTISHSLRFDRFNHQEQVIEENWRKLKRTLWRFNKAVRTAYQLRRQESARTTSQYPCDGFGFCPMRCNFFTSLWETDFECVVFFYYRFFSYCSGLTQPLTFQHSDRTQKSQGKGLCF